MSYHKILGAKLDEATTEKVVSNRKLAELTACRISYDRGPETVITCLTVTLKQSLKSLNVKSFAIADF